MRLPLISLLWLWTASALGGPLTHGPFVGHTTATSVHVWARAEWSGAYYLGARPAGIEGWQVVAAEANAASDYTLKWRVDDLEPAQEYEYQIFDSRGKPAYTELLRFVTAPAIDVPARVEIVFGSCAAEDEGTGRVWERIRAVVPDAVVLLGDTPYIDTTDLTVQRRRYREFADFAPLAAALTSTPFYGTWDDHDFGKNDTDGNLPGKESSRQAFIEYHAHSSYGDGSHGIYTSFRRGPIEVFLLDTRYFAATAPSPFAREQPTLLGRAQWDWLRSGLEASTASFKVIACGMVFNGATRPGKPDHWMTYPHERRALFELIGTRDIRGVVLVSGDIHRSRVLRYAKDTGAGYPVTELITSPMHGRIIEAANAPHPDLVWDAGAPNSFLLLSADATGAAPVLTARFVNADGEELHTERLELGELSGTPYARADLPPLLEFLDGRTVDTSETWQERRVELRGLLEEYFIGTYPDEVPAIAEARLVGAKRHGDGSLRKRVRLALETPRRVTFELEIWVPGAPGPHPLLLTQPRYYQIPWAEEAVARGYVVCLYPGVDSHHHETDYPDYERVWENVRAEYPAATWTEISTKAWIASRALDYLLSPASDLDIAPGQVGIIGFSRYGKQSLIAAAYDERITSVVARSPGSPGSCPYRFTSRNTCAEAPADFPGSWFLPSLRSFTGREHTLPVDAHAWMGLIAPRHCLVHTAHNDGSEPTFAVERAYLEARRVYELLGTRDRLRLHYRTGQHGPITDEHRRQNLDWFDLSFGRGGSLDAFPEELLHHFDWPAWRRAQGELSDIPSIERAASDDERRRRLRWLLGEPPEEEPPRGEYGFLSEAESAMMTHDRWAIAGVERRRVSFGRNVRGNIYFRSDLSEPAPAIVWLHPYSYHSGYNEGYGVEGTTVYHRLAAAGFVVLAFDQCGFGLRLLEGRDFYQKHPRWSRLGRMVRDVHDAVDFLQGGAGRTDGDPPPLDPVKIGVLGYSVGGMVGLVSAALDERIAYVGCFGGFTSLRVDTDDQPTGGNRRLWEWHALLPRLGLFHGRESEIPIDFDDVLHLVAPRACLIGSPRRDRDADFPAVEGLVDAARFRWAAAGRPGAFEHYAPDTHGRFQKAEQEVFVDWLRAQQVSKKD